MNHHCECKDFFLLNNKKKCFSVFVSYETY